MSSHTPLIELRHCSLILDGHTVLDDIDFTLRRGERWALIGANGSGKTMLLKMLRGDVWPTPSDGDGLTARERRRYYFDGEPSDEPAGSKVHIAYIGPERQDKYVRYGWNLTAAQVVTTGLFDEDIPLTSPTRAQRLKVERVLRRFGVWGLRQRRMLTLSYGQRRLVLVARAFAGEAQVLLLDEVFNGLDERAKAKLRRALERPHAGHDWILSSHRPHELPRNVTHVAYLEGGSVIYAGAKRKRSVLHSSPNTAEAKPGFASGRTIALGRISVRKERAADSVALLALRAGAPSGHPARRASRTSQRIEAGEGATGAQQFLVRVSAATLYRDYRPVIRNLDWTLRRGEHWAVMGANGAGKSTLLSCIYGDLHAALGGSIERDGVPYGTRIEEWKRRVGWVSPELQADHYLAKSVEEIVISGRYSSVGLNDAATRPDRVTAKRWMDFFGIEDLRKRGPKQVSYGQMRLALIARAMVNEPELLLLDEPCTGLDGDMRVYVLEALERLAQSGTQVVMAVHDKSDIIPSVGWILQIERGGRARVKVRPNR